jgi:mono/diheme cytochrome c family protein
MRKSIYPASLLAAGLLGVVATPVFPVEQPATVTIQLPEDPTHFMAGPNLEAASKNCVECHSADYIYMQPPLTQEQWHALVLKMKKTYGAPIDDGDVDAVVSYLMSQNGTSQ